MLFLERKLVKNDNAWASPTATSSWADNKTFEEMGNLRVKNVGMDIVLEAINKRFHDDRYYAFAYGLWRIKEIEEARMKNNENGAPESAI